jgi:hypothetical protein
VTAPAPIIAVYDANVLYPGEPDAFVMDLLARDPDAVHAVARAHRSQLRKPPMTPAEYLAQLGRAGLRKTAESLEQAGVDL